MVVRFIAYMLAYISSRMPDHPPWLRAGVLAVAQDLHSVDEDVRDAVGVLMRILVGRACRDRVRIEDDDVGEISGLQQTALRDAEVCGGVGGHAADRFRQRDDVFLANVLAEEIGEVAVGPGMR